MSSDLYVKSALTRLRSVRIIKVQLKQPQSKSRSSPPEVFLFFLRQLETYFSSSRSVEGFSVSKSISISSGLEFFSDGSRVWMMCTTRPSLSPGNLLMSRLSWRFSSYDIGLPLSVDTPPNTSGEESIQHDTVVEDVKISPTENNVHHLHTYLFPLLLRERLRGREGSAPAGGEQSDGCSLLLLSSCDWRMIWLAPVNAATTTPLR